MINRYEEYKRAIGEKPRDLIKNLIDLNIVLGRQLAIIKYKDRFVVDYAEIENLSDAEIDEEIFVAFDTGFLDKFRKGVRK